MQFDFGLILTFYSRRRLILISFESNLEQSEILGSGKRNQKSALIRILERFRDSNEESALEIESDGLSLTTDFKERVLPLGIPNDYARYIESLHGIEGEIGR